MPLILFHDRIRSLQTISTAVEATTTMEGGEVNVAVGHPVNRQLQPESN